LHSGLVKKRTDFTGSMGIDEPIENEGISGCEGANGMSGVIGWSTTTGSTASNYYNAAVLTNENN